MTIKHIFHLSDLHIRNGDEKYSRYNEYINVFDNLFISIKNNIKKLKLSDNEYIIVITGDIFHNKNNIGNFGLMLWKILIKNLTNIGLTIILEGNHDSIQHQINQPSLVTSTFEMNNLIILNETKSFIIDDIGFSYVNIRDTLDNYDTSGRKNVLPEFPKIENDNIKYKIALFHGTFANIKLYNGTQIRDENNPYPFEWIKNFDFALLGDIHLRQKDYYKSLLWCYSGSLIQQNYGEDIINHGYVIWNLENKSITDVNVYNNIGFINIKQDSENKQFYIRETGKFILLEEHIIKNIHLFPKIIEIKLFSNINFIELFDILSKYNIKFNILNKNNIIDSSNNISDISNIITHSFDKDNLLSYFKNHLSNEQYNILLNIVNNYDTLLFNKNDYPIDLEDECIKKNKDLNLIINNCQNSDNIHTINNKFNIKYLEWTSLYCYNDINWINFDTLSASTFMVSGKNGTGKSAIYDILTYAIWGDITKHKFNSELSSGIINYNSNCAKTIIDIETNNITYRIVRNINVRKDTTLINKINISLYYVILNEDGSIKYELIKKNNACKAEIENLFGTIDTFLSSSMITQNIDFDILKMNYKNCTELIDKASNIDFIYNLFNLFKNSINKYKDFKKIIDSKKQVYEHIISDCTNDNNCNNIDELNIELNQIINEKNNIFDILNNINIPNDINITEVLNTNYDLLISELNNIIKNKQEYNNYIDELNNLKFNLKNLSDNDIIEYSKLYNKNDFNEILDIDKPCDDEHIKNEKEFIDNNSKYIINDKYINDDLITLKKSLKFNENNLKKSNIDLANINDDKPISIIKPIYEFDYITNNICLIYNNIDNFIEFCNNNIYYKIDSEINLDEIITLDEFYKYKNNLNKITHSININKKKIEDVSNNIKEFNDKLNSLNNIPEPSVKIKFKTSLSTKKYIDKFNQIDDIKNKIINDNIIINNYNNDNYIITQLIDDNNILKKELQLLNSKNEYKYDPECSFCILQPWVVKINELKNNILNYDNNIIKLQKELENYNIHNIIKNNNNNNVIINKYNLHYEWYQYYLYNETNLKLKNLYSIFNISNELIKNSEIQFNTINNIINKFYNLSYNLFDIHNNLISYYNYNNWLHKYNTINNDINKFNNEVTLLNNTINYLENIKPRIDNYLITYNKYNIWKNNNTNKTIINSNRYIYLKNNINIFEKFNNYTYLNGMKPIINNKIMLKEKIKIIDNRIIEINNILVKFKSTSEYLNNYKKSLLLLHNSDIYISNIIDIINIIISKFKDYKKWLYNNHILKNIIINTNSIIKTLCHDDTKMFELDYILSENKDIIHINWLIKNVDNLSNKQNISIYQASGFQHFVISLALRLTLFNNNICNQLFIDEGFTAFDKHNLSIVPNFLKSLLRLFNTIIIVSHIDLIQDSVDKNANIIYNYKNKTSSIKFGKNI
tara:strand:+ start:32668 stop:36951 length:4284 start_codon:yes stop_codon:yes gene_type:complete